jgi:internalin A
MARDAAYREAETKIEEARRKRVARFSLSHMHLTEVPKSLGQLTQLQTINLSNNQLTLLPESLRQLPQLQGLSQLTSLPESLGQLAQLQTLHLSNNQLTLLPESLRQLRKLKRLFLHGNDALGIPPEILGPTAHDVYLNRKDAAAPAAILDYYFSTRGIQGRALRELKLIVVGRGGAGKTSLVRRLKGQSFNPDESETHGIVISPLTLNCADGPVTARVWDFGGQHVLHAMHEFFLTARSLYLLVLGERDDLAERDAAYWLQLIRSYAGSAPVAVALNKSQGRMRDMDRDTLEKNYGPIIKWIPTECAEGWDGTIANLRAALTNAADDMQQVRDLFPAKWWDIKQWLETMTEPYLAYATFQAHCNTLGEKDPVNQDTLAAWLNDLGIAINYADDQRLHDTTVLRPDWLANGIYAILRANDATHGRHLAPDATLTVESLGPIYAASEKLGMLKAAEYPAEKWPFLLRLMSLFQLAFPLDEQGQKLLVPSLLPVEPPAGSDEPTDSERTRLRYEFAVVPGPLLPRFLVRTFPLIEDDRRWRRGAILRYGDARARVWTTQDERWLQVTAIGPQHHLDELLTMIRGMLAELFTEYKDLRVVEQWEYNGNWVPRKTLEDMGVLKAEKDGEEVEP